MRRPSRSEIDEDRERDAFETRPLGDAARSLRYSLSALLYAHGTEAVLGALVECASFSVDARDESDVAVAARRAAVEMSRAAASAVALERLPGAVAWAEILAPKRRHRPARPR